MEPADELGTAWRTPPAFRRSYAARRSLIFLLMAQWSTLAAYSEQR